VTGAAVAAGFAGFAGFAKPSPAELVWATWFPRKPSLRSIAARAIGFEPGDFVG
jgi:hypothetical protein